MSIQVKNLVKNFGQFRALNDVSLDMPSGELVALLGPSGCGKTTLLRIIAGLEKADQGSVELSGEDVAGQHVRDRQVGFVFQHYALFRHKTVFENVAFGLRMKPKRQRPSEAQIRQKVNRLLELVQLGWLEDRYPSQLSGGQRQRIALARALAVEPRLLLLDEPFGALDAKVRKELRRWLRQLHDELHITSVFVTHDQEEAMEVADRVVLLNRGRVEQQGTPEEVYRQPASAFVYSFLGSVNRFEGLVVGHGIQINGQILPHKTEGWRQGDSIQAFARPHDIEIVTGVNDSSSPTGSIPARIERILGFGPLCRIELVGLHEYQDQYFEVDISAGHTKVLALQQGQRVALLPSRLKFFAAA